MVHHSYREQPSRMLFQGAEVNCNEQEPRNSKGREDCEYDHVPRMTRIDSGALCRNLRESQGQEHSEGCKHAVAGHYKGADLEEDWMHSEKAWNRRAENRPTGP